MEYSVSKINFSAPGYFTELVLQYLNGNSSLKSFYNLDPSYDFISDAIIQKKNQPIQRIVLSDAIRKQYGNLLEKNSPVDINISALQNENTFTVVTAHQPNLFLGPLYLIYKITSVIKMSELLNEKFPANKFVPVFWLGSEDHDTDELNHIHLFGKKIEWTPEQKGSFGKQKTETLKTQLDEIAAIAGNSPHADELMELLRSAYLESKNISEATRKLLHCFFGDKGLVIVDGDDLDLKKLFLPVLRDELLNSSSERLVNETSEQLQKNYELQITPRNINLFYLKENLRERIVREGEKFDVLNTEISFSKEEILNELEQRPEHFSPNVVLRPLYQETVLPNIAFIGGGAEVSYFLLLKKMFEHFRVAFPMVFLRDSALVIDKNSTERLHKMGLSTENIFETAEQLIKQFTQLQAGDSVQLEKEKTELQFLFEKLKQTILLKDKSLAQQLDAEQTRSIKFIQSLEERMLKTEKKKYEDSIQQIRKLKEKLFPDNSLQERHDNFISFYLTYGKDFFAMLHSSFNAFERKFTVITLD